MTTQADSAPGTTARAVTATICGQTEVGPVRPGNQDAIVVASAVAAVTGTRLTWTGRVPEAGAVVAVVEGGFDQLFHCHVRRLFQEGIYGFL